MIRRLFPLCIFFLLGSWAWAHEGHSHGETDTDVAIQVQQEFLNYLKNSENVTDPKVEAFIEIRGRRYALNSSFYQLLGLTIQAADSSACSSCVVEEVKGQTRSKRFLQKVSEKVNDVFNVQTVAYGANFLDEYGYAAGVGYIMMELLEHTAFGPLGICPILNFYYLYALDVIKQGQYVFTATYKASTDKPIYVSIAKAIYFSFRSAFETMRLNKALKRPIFVYADAGSDVRTDHVFPWGQFKKLRKDQGRLSWFMWKQWLDQKLSRRTLWPSAYMNLDLAKTDEHAHEHPVPFKMLQAPTPDGKPSPFSFLKCESTSCAQEDAMAQEWWTTLPQIEKSFYEISYLQFKSTTATQDELISYTYRLRDIETIMDLSQPVEVRYMNASVLQDILIFEFQALESLFQADLKKARAQMSAWQYLKASRKFHQLKIQIKKYGSALKAMAMEKDQLNSKRKKHAIVELGLILGIFEKASSIRENEGSLLEILDLLIHLKTCDELLT